MIMKKKSIAIIPARGSSKGIPRKNIVKICGKPLIAYTIDCAIKSEVFDKIIVSTEDDEIAEISKKYGAEIIKRPQRLAKDDTLTLPVIKHALAALKNKNYVPDFVYKLQPTSPLRTFGEIKKISELMQSGKYSGIVTVCGYNYKAPLTLDKDGIISFLNEDDLSKRRQDFGKLYKVTGSIYAYKTASVLGMKVHLFEKKTLGFVASELTSMDIDTQEDLKIAEALINYFNDKSSNFRYGRCTDR